MDEKLEYTFSKIIGKAKIDIGNGQVMCECKRTHNLERTCECEGDKNG